MARCLNCGETWDRDPVLEVPCPACAAGVGEKCRRPSEHTGGFVHPHTSRDEAALREVEGYGRCDHRPEGAVEEDDGTEQTRLTV